MEHIVGTEIQREHETAVTLGNFDGIHQGHRELIRQTMAYAQKENLESVVFSFTPHPMFLFKNRNTDALILAPDEKTYAMEQTGIDVYIEYPFTKEFADMDPEAFARMIFERLKCKVLVVGENYKFGREQKGDYRLLKELGVQYGVKVLFVPSVLYDGERVSSTRIRNCLLNRDIETANLLLTTPYFILGEVMQGKKLGRTIGFPTINILADPVKLFPPNGVYATRTIYQDTIYLGVTNVGFNPTVNGSFKVVETYLFHFHHFVYGERLKTCFFKWLRAEQKFPSVEALRMQMETDAKNAEAYFHSAAFAPWAGRIFK